MDLRLEPYDLALNRPWVSAHGEMRRRRGWWLSLAHQGAIGRGEIAPMPVMGSESFAQALHIAKLAQQAWVSLSIDAALDWLRRKARDYPAACCGLEFALLNCLATQQGKNLAKYLNPQAADKVHVNASIGGLDAGVAARAESAISAGYRCLKLKLGLASVESEMTRVEALCATLPSNARLRLDANQAWSFNTALRAISGLRDLPIDGLEEPLASPNINRLERLQALAPWPIALDESLSAAHWRDWVEAAPVRRIVIKPNLLGGPRKATQIVERARSVGMETVITSCLESPLGVHQLLQLTRVLDHEARQIHGLATGDCFTGLAGERLIQQRGNEALMAPG